MKHEWEVRYHDDGCFWYVEKPQWYSLPKCYDEEFTTEEEAQEIADALNKPPSNGLKRAMRLDVKEGLSSYFDKIYMSEWGI